MLDVIELGGRRFGVIDFDRRTSVNDDYLGKLLRAVGADRVMPMDGEGNDAYLIRLQMCLSDSLRKHEFVAGILLDEGKTERDFDPEYAAKGVKEVAAFIASCNTPEDRERINELAMRVTLDFFREGLSWLRRFRSFSEGTTEAPSARALNAIPVAPA